MTQKEALKQLQSYCAINGFALYPSSLPKQTYAIILACGDDGEITTRYPNKLHPERVINMDRRILRTLRIK